MKKDTPLLRLGGFLFRYRSFTPLPAIILTLVVFQPYNLGKLNVVITLLGLSCALLGEAIRITAVGFSAHGASGRESFFRAEALNTDGLYSLTRNPLYIGNCFIFTGLLVVYANPWALIIVTLFLTFQYYAIIRAEESFLAVEYGKPYHEYLKKVPRIFPSFSGYRTPVNRFDFRRVLFKEKDSAFNLLFMFLLILAVKELRFYGHVVTAAPLLTAAIVLIGAYFVVHILKRRANC